MWVRERPKTHTPTVSSSFFFFFLLWWSNQRKIRIPTSRENKKIRQKEADADPGFYLSICSVMMKEVGDRVDDLILRCWSCYASTVIVPESHGAGCVVFSCEPHQTAALFPLSTQTFNGDKFVRWAQMNCILIAWRKILEIANAYHFHGVKFDGVDIPLPPHFDANIALLISLCQHHQTAHLMNSYLRAPKQYYGVWVFKPKYLLCDNTNVILRY